MYLFELDQFSHALQKFVAVEGGETGSFCRHVHSGHVVHRPKHADTIVNAAVCLHALKQLLNIFLKKLEKTKLFFILLGFSPFSSGKKITAKYLLFTLIQKLNFLLNYLSIVKDFSAGVHLEGCQGLDFGRIPASVLRTPSNCQHVIAKCLSEKQFVDGRLGFQSRRIGRPDFQSRAGKLTRFFNISKRRKNTFVGNATTFHSTSGFFPFDEKFQ